MKMLCEKDFDLSLVENLLNLSKFEEMVRQKLNEEIQKYEVKNLKGDINTNLNSTKLTGHLRRDVIIGANLEQRCHQNKRVIRRRKNHGL